MKRSIFFSLIPVILILSLAACQKEAGEGGTSSIFVKVYVKDYNSTFTVLQGEYYGPDEDVYIIYGDDRTFADKVSTNYDGTYEFKYLRKGKYTVYAYSKDSTLQTTAKLAVIQEVEVTDNQQEVEVPDIVIFN